MEYRIIRLRYSTLQRMKELMPPMKNESLTSYFDRLSHYLNYLYLGRK